jgi:hypothetical protein
MRVGPIPENILERFGAAAGLIPYPVLDTMISLMLARTIMSGAELGIFDALAHGMLPPESIARSRKFDLFATKKLLRALVAAGYLKESDGAYGPTYGLTRRSWHWVTRDSPDAFRDGV